MPIHYWYLSETETAVGHGMGTSDLVHNTQDHFCKDGRFITLTHSLYSNSKILRYRIRHTALVNPLLLLLALSMSINRLLHYLLRCFSVSGAVYMSAGVTIILVVLFNGEAGIKRSR